MFWVWWLDVQTLRLKLVGSENVEIESRLLWIMIWLKRVPMIFSYMMLDIRSISFQKYKNRIKFLGDMQFLSRAICLQAVLTLNRQRWGWCYKPHKSKVKSANKANLFRIKVRTLSCALGISKECDIVATPDQQPKSKTLLGMSKGLAWGSCWRCLSAIFTHQLYSIIKENHMPYSHICITNLTPQLFLSFVYFRWAGVE